MEDKTREHLESRFYADLNKDEQGYKWQFVESGVHPSVDIYTKFAKGELVETKCINVPLEFLRKIARDLNVSGADHQRGYMVRNIETHEVLKYINDQGVCEDMTHTFCVGGENLREMLIGIIRDQNHPNCRRFDLNDGEFSFEMREGQPVLSLKVRDTGSRGW